MERNDNRNERLDSEVARTLASLHALEDVEVGPYFFARLHARLEAAEDMSEGRLMHFFFAGRLAPSLLAIMVALNIVTAAIILKSGPSTQSISRDTRVEALADQYLTMGASEALENSSK